MATIRQQLIDLVRARVAAVPGLSGVFIWRVSPFPQEELPAAIVRDEMCRSRVAATNVHEHRLQFSVEIFATDTEQVRGLVGAVLESIGLDVRWKESGAPLAVTTEPLSDSIVTQQEERFLAGARVEFVVVYRTPAFKPEAVYP